MKAKFLTILIILAVTLAAISFPAQASTTDNIINCTGTETMIAFLSPGEWKTVGNHTRVRGMMMQYLEEATCPQAAGVNTVVLNANWDQNMVGPIWGTHHSETSYGGGGAWEGKWHGKTNPNGSTTYNGVTRGVSGSVEGMIMWFKAYAPPGGGTQVTYTIRMPAK